MPVFWYDRWGPAFLYYSHYGLVKPGSSVPFASVSLLYTQIRAERGINRNARKVWEVLIIIRRTHVFASLFISTCLTDPLPELYLSAAVLDSLHQGQIDRVLFPLVMKSTSPCSLLSSDTSSFG